MLRRGGQSLLASGRACESVLERLGHKGSSVAAALEWCVKNVFLYYSVWVWSMYCGRVVIDPGLQRRIILTLPCLETLSSMWFRGYSAFKISYDL